MTDEKNNPTVGKSFLNTAVSVAHVDAVEAAAIAAAEATAAAEAIAAAEATAAAEVAASQAAALPPQEVTTAVERTPFVAKRNEKGHFLERPSGIRPNLFKPGNPYRFQPGNQLGRLSTGVRKRPYGDRCVDLAECPIPPKTLRRWQREFHLPLESGMTFGDAIVLAIGIKCVEDASVAHFNALVQAAEGKDNAPSVAMNVTVEQMIQDSVDDNAIVISPGLELLAEAQGPDHNTLEHVNI